MKFRYPDSESSRIKSFQGANPAVLIRFPLYNRHMLQISNDIAIPEEEIELNAIRSQGAGGQNVNKVASAIHLRFDIKASSLPDRIKVRLLAWPDHRISSRGVIIIKAQQHRHQERNRIDALERLKSLVQSVIEEPRKRIATRPSKTAKRKRLDEKTRRGQLKEMRKKVLD